MSGRGVTATYAREMLRRQFPPRFGMDYLPAQRAMGREAPSETKPAVIESSLLQRKLHAIARTEKSPIALALYHPRTFDVKEQHALSPTPWAHPLVGHPKAKGLLLPSTTGTAAIAERLGLLSKHPMAREKISSARGETYRWVPVPLLRDLLLFLTDDLGPYCVEWDIKKNKGDHGQPGPGDWVERSSPRRLANSRAIDDIYCEYMRELGIRIVRVAQSDLDPILRINLNRLVMVHAQPIDLSAEVHAELLDAYDRALVRGTPPNEVIDDFVCAGVNAADAKRVLEQAIWHRRIRIDLYQPWSIDRPLTPERRDVLEDFAGWFRRAQ